MEDRNDALEMLKADAEGCPLFMDTDAVKCESCPLIMYCMNRREEVAGESC